jgi:hypothetical protein
MMKIINWKDNKNKLKDPPQVIKLSSSLIKEPKKSIYGTDGTLDSTGLALWLGPNPPVPL